MDEAVFLKPVAKEWKKYWSNSTISPTCMPVLWHRINGILLRVCCRNIWKANIGRPLKPESKKHWPTILTSTPRHKYLIMILTTIIHLLMQAKPLSTPNRMGFFWRLRHRNTPRCLPMPSTHVVYLIYI